MKVSICISSTWIKTNTNQLVQLQHIRGSGGELAVFLLWRKIFITTGKKKFQSSVWQACQFLVLAGNWQFFCCGGKFSLRLEKKSSSRLSGGCVSFCFWREMGNFFVVAGGDYDRKKKKFQSSPERLRPENKKVQVVIKFVLVQLEL